MTEKSKKILLIILILALVGVILGIVFFFLIKKTIPFFPTGGGGATTTTNLPGAGGRIPVGGTTTPSGSGVLPTAGNVITGGPAYFKSKPVEQISTDYALFSNMNTNGQLRYHNASDGKYYKIDANGNLVSLSDRVFYGVKNTTWAKTKDTAVIEYPDSSKIIYNFSEQKQYSIPKHWQEFSFSPDGTEVVGKSIGLNKDNNWLVTVKDDGTGTQTIEPMGANADKVTVDWSPSGQTAALSRTGDTVAADQEEVLLVGLHGENFKSIITEGFGFNELWSPSGNQLLFSVYSDRSNYKPELWIVNAYGDSIGSNRRLLSLNTWANKCAFADENTIYCAVPQNVPTGAGMQPDLVSDSFDDLYKIDLKSNIKTKINLDSDYTFKSLGYDVKENKIIFTDTNKNGIYKVNL